MRLLRNWILFSALCAIPLQVAFAQPAKLKLLHEFDEVTGKFIAEISYVGSPDQQFGFAFERNEEGKLVATIVPAAKDTGRTLQIHITGTFKDDDGTERTFVYKLVEMHMPVQKEPVMIFEHGEFFKDWQVLFDRDDIQETKRPLMRVQEDQVRSAIGVALQKVMAIFRQGF